MPRNDMEMLSSVYKEIGEQCGFDVALKIYHLYRGQQICFPVRIFDKDVVHTKIIEEYDGTNIRKLAEKYKYSEKTVRRIVKADKEKHTRTVFNTIQNKEEQK